jgi:hypothetical protein
MKKLSQDKLYPRLDLNTALSQYKSEVTDSLVPICTIYATYHTPLQQRRNVIPQLRWLAVSSQPRWPEFDPRSDHVRFMVDEVALQLV